MTIIRKLWHRILCFFRKHEPVEDVVMTARARERDPSARILRCNWCGKFMDVPGRGKGI